MNNDGGAASFFCFVFAGGSCALSMRELNGCGMRSSVGFLSRRELTGEPLIKEEFQRRRLAGCTSLYKKDMLGHFGCVNAIEFSNNGGEWLVSGELTNAARSGATLCVRASMLTLTSLAAR